MAGIVPVFDVVETKFLVCWRDEADWLYDGVLHTVSVYTSVLSPIFSCVPLSRVSWVCHCVLSQTLRPVIWDFHVFERHFDVSLGFLILAGVLFCFFLWILFWYVVIELLLMAGIVPMFDVVETEFLVCWRWCRLTVWWTVAYCVGIYFNLVAHFQLCTSVTCVTSMSLCTVQKHGSCMSCLRSRFCSNQIINVQNYMPPFSICIRVCMVYQRYFSY